MASLTSTTNRPARTIADQRAALDALFAGYQASKARRPARDDERTGAEILAEIRAAIG